MRNRWVFPAAFLLSALFHAGLLFFPWNPVSGPGGATGGVEGAAWRRAQPTMEVLNVLPTPARQTRTEGPDRVDVVNPAEDEGALEASDLETRSLPSPASVGGTAQDRFRRLRPERTDTRLWGGPEPSEADPRTAPLRITRALLDSVIRGSNEPDVRIGRVGISIPSCDTFLTCQLDFRSMSRVNDAFGRYLEIEQQGALTALYRERREAMKVRRGNRQ